MSKVFIFRSFINIFQHSSSDLRFGWLGLVFISPHAHRIHHLNDARYYNRNFGTDITLWDHLLGTFLYEVRQSSSEMDRSFGVDKSGESGFFVNEMFNSTQKSLRRFFLFKKTQNA